jgi:hypothetical protein
MEASLSQGDDARHGVAVCPRVDSVYLPPGRPVLPDTARGTVFRSDHRPLLAPACICVSCELTVSGLVRSQRRLGKSRWPWESTSAWQAYGSPKIKAIALGLPTHHDGQEGARGFRSFLHPASGGGTQSTFGLPPGGLNLKCSRLTQTSNQILHSRNRSKSCNRSNCGGGGFAASHAAQPCRRRSAPERVSEQQGRGLPLSRSCPG